MDVDKVKHLEFIQNVIVRLAGNSFLIKGWTVTLVTGLVALASKDANPNFGLMALAPITIFFFLDAFYLRQEKLYRALYQSVIAPNSNIPTYSLDVSGQETSHNSYTAVLLSGTILPLYGGMAASVLVLTFVLRLLPASV